VNVTVRLFAVARQRAGRSEVTVEVPDPPTVGTLRRVLAAAHPELAQLVGSLMIAVAAEYVPDDALIPPDAEVAAIPPVSGGGPDPTRTVAL
jgi:molybdopterin converting factor subunit 1